jgi:energy-coupling factor transporter ATP-binding protein EcfA2
MNEAVITNVGPIATLRIPIPERGGLCVLRGHNGSGKSHALNVLGRAVTGKKDLKVPIKDGEREARFDGFGVTLLVSRKSQIRGEATVYSLESRLSVSSLIDPGIDDPEAADAKRIKAIISLLYPTADPSLFYEICGGAAEFDKHVGPAAKDTDDILVMASRVKRALEQQARKEGDEAKNLLARHEAARQAIEGIDTSGEHDSASLQTRLTDAVAHKQRLESEQKAAKQHAEQIELAKFRLQKAEAEYTGPTVTDAGKIVFEETKLLHLLEDELAAAETEVIAAQKKRDLSKQQVERQTYIAQREIQKLAAAEQHEKTIRSWQQTINDDNARTMSVITADDIANAQAAVNNATRAVKMGGVIEDALRQKKLGEQYKIEGEKHQRESERFRDAAKATDRVLSDIVAKSGVPLAIEQVNEKMRLVTPSERGPKTLFSDLSPGERTMLSLAIAGAAFERQGDQLGELTLEQYCYEQLDPGNKKKVALWAEEKGILVYTAEAADGELRAEIVNSQS